MNLKNVFKRVWSVVCIVFFIGIFIALIGNVSSKVDAIYDFIKVKSYVIVSNSMQPMIDPGDVIFVKKSNIDTLEIGDVITFQKDGFIATHRIIEIQDEQVITQGDNNNLQDEPLDKTSIIGEYMFKVPKIGYLYSFAGSPIGMIAIAVVIVIFIIYEVCFVDDKKTGSKGSKKD